jgi:hypothetical protein
MSDKIKRYKLRKLESEKLLVLVLKEFDLPTMFKHSQHSIFITTYTLTQ